MYAYCNNNPINNIDSLGLWTISLSVSFSGVCGLGISAGIGFAFDDQGNFDWQYSYAIPGVDGTSMVGAVGVGLGVGLQYTKAETVYDLYGPATYIGASAGPGWYVGGDIVSFSDASDPQMTTDGFHCNFAPTIANETLGKERFYFQKVPFHRFSLSIIRECEMYVYTNIFH